ncbi:MAG: tRNA (adenosine(37)-N6)-threonylcarbamoyltransferase complex dimerization subunit type 1 TsaB [Christensenella sp.]|nr:tRNA (adenosine(37)-N6)-threonylcarbamoyltransferase complex dimerization subunit type 1 TsaB [Christensenella sp.]
MNILGLDTTGNTLSVAVNRDGKLVSEVYIDNGLKHSTTLMSAVQSALEAAEIRIGEIDVFAVAAGPGSFTGIRIGVAACASMAHAGYKKTAPVSTLDALMENAAGTPGIVCAVMDARRGEVYTAARRQGSDVVEECAMPLETLVTQVLPVGEVTFVGDAAYKFREKILELRPDSLFLPDAFLMQRASSVCVVASRMAREGRLLEYDGLTPHYLRESQAERLKKSGK